MNLDRSLERAKHARRSRRRAAVLFNDIEYELALGAPTAAQERHGELALELLERRFPGVKAEARDVEQPPSLSRRAGERLRDGARTIKPSRSARPGAHPRLREPSRRDRHEPRRPRRRRVALRTLELGAVVAAVAAGAALLVRHCRRHPKHAVAAGVVVLAVGTGRPSLIGTAAVIAALIAIARRGHAPRAPQPPALPRAPHPPALPRAPGAPRWSR
jgi:hypothetical protein